MKSHLKNKRTTKYSFGRTALFENDIKHLRKQFKNCCNNCYINLTGKKKGMKAFITSQIRGCPLVWIFQGRCLNNKINSLHKERGIKNNIWKSYWLWNSEGHTVITIHFREEDWILSCMALNQGPSHPVLYPAVFLYCWISMNTQILSPNVPE